MKEFFTVISQWLINMKVFLLVDSLGKADSKKKQIIYYKCASIKWAKFINLLHRSPWLKAIRKNEKNHILFFEYCCRGKISLKTIAFWIRRININIYYCIIYYILYIVQMIFKCIEKSKWLTKEWCFDIWIEGNIESKESEKLHNYCVGEILK